MRVLFFVHVLGRTRHFKNVVSGLVERGHTVILSPALSDSPEKARRGLYDHPRVEVAPCPAHRHDRWGPVMDPMRRARDYMRFFDPRYRHAVTLAARAAEQAPQAWTRTLENHPWLKTRWRGVQRAMALAESVVPCDPAFLRFVETQHADVLLVTPLVEFGSYQTEYVKCAHHLGLPVLYLPFSWDNLTNRGLIRVHPDRALVWNAHQRREATEFHDVPEARIVVTGAPRFDEFFQMEPETSRETFCRAVGFEAARPLILYICSSGFVAPREVDFVRRWVTELRAAAGDTWLRQAQVLVRPHPAYQEQWNTADLSDLAGVAVWAQKSSMQADQRLFDSLFHAEAVVGLNTSAMIEAAIVGRPVYTVAAPEFSGGQHGTFHWYYLLTDHGGVVSMKDTFADHMRDLADAPAHATGTRDRARVFLEHFVRPRGLPTPASQVMVDEIERAVADIRKTPAHPPAWHAPLRWALDLALRAGLDRCFVKTSRAAP